jgi:hypothetical protein
MYMCAMIVKLASVLTIFLLEFVTMTILRCGIFSFSFLLLKTQGTQDTRRKQTKHQHNTQYMLYTNTHKQTLTK